MLDNHNASPSFAMGSGGDASIFSVNQLPDILGLVQSKLQQSAVNAELFAQVFGDKANTAELQAVRSQWAIGDFSQLPTVQIIAAESANSALGAYSSSTQTVYLSDALLQPTAAPSNSLFGAAGVLVEETFHWLDDRVGGDTQGDEGELAKNLLFGSDLSASELARIKNEDDRGFMQINGDLLSVEQATTPVPTPIISLPVITIATSDNAAAETNTGAVVNAGQFVLTRTGSLTSALTVNLAIAGTATNGVDFRTIPTTATFAAGSAKALINVSAINDFRFEGTETVAVSLKTSTAYRLGTGTSATINLLDNEFDNAGNTLATAKVLAGGAQQSINDFLDSKDVDFYKLSINATNPAYDLSISFSQLTNDAHIALLRADGTVINSTGVYFPSGATSTPVAASKLFAGVKGGETYYLKASSNALNGTAYNLGLSLTPIAVPKADLTSLGQTTTAPVTVGSNLTVSTATRNIGNATAAASTTKYWLSNNTTLDSSDIALGSVAIASLSAGAIKNSSLTFAYNSSWGTGTKYVLFQADSGSTVAESNETNNIAFATINVSAAPVLRPDLTLVSQSATNAVTVGGNVNIAVGTRNIGNGTAAASTTKYWLSNNTTLDSSDIALGSVAIAGLSAGGTQTSSLTFAYNNSWGTGTKYVLFQADSGSTVSESNETNNIAFATIFVTPPPTGDWFSQNIQDVELRTIARSKFTDGKLDRNEMISIFKDAEDGNTISNTELLDLRKLVTNASYLGIADYVKVLSNKLVNGDVANTKSGIGNLSANSSASQMTSLIGKWFLGSDRPDTSYTYQYASGSLFQNGVSYQDINQGSVGNCYLLAGLAATAFRSPSTIQNMFIDNGDNTYTVRFYNNGVADYVTVDRYLPTTSWGTFIYAHQSASDWGKYNSATNELWVALAEKAYAQLNESGWIGQDNTNSYAGISGGWEGAAIKQITGLSASYKSLNFDSMVTAFTSGKFMTFASKDSGVAANVAANHAYTVVGYNSTTQKFKLFNPWGVDNGSSKSGILELGWSELTASFSGWTHTV
jgi:hypothetical protein